MNLKQALPDRIKYIFDLFEAHEYELYIVGGVVRDMIMNRPLGDWDFTTNATPEEILKLVPDSFYDNKFGTVGVKSDGRPYEITTFRTEKGYSDGRHPDEIVWGRTLEEDLSRRDFTINAMALKPDAKRGLTLIDPFGGQDDINSQIIKTVGSPVQRFSEDALRMMRAIRIAAQLHFAIEEETFLAIKKCSEKLGLISAERVRDELFKILASDFPADGYVLLRNTGLAELILPEMEKTFGVEQKSPGRHHVYDVGTHSVESLRFCPSPDPVTRLATLIHDSGKAKTQRKYPDGRITFYNHEMESAKIAENLASRLRFSNEQKDKLVKLVRWHQFTVDERQTDSAVRRFIKNVGIDLVPEMLALRVGDRLGGGARETSWRLEEFKARLIEVQKQPFAIPDLKINGKDVMGVKGIDPGPMVGKYLQYLFDEVVENKLSNERQELLRRLESVNL
jgi:tRNA nucleotidyltransferase/poly(A) polymerase